MLLLRAASRESDINIEYIPYVEVTAYPSLERRVLDTSDFLPITGNPENFQYSLKAAVNAAYVAKGTIQFPTLSEQKYPLTFRTAEPLRREWYLALGEGDGRISGSEHTPVIEEFLARMDLGKPRHRHSVAEEMGSHIEKYFFDGSHGAKKGEYYAYVIQAFSAAAKEDYSSILKERVTAGFGQSLLPQKYRGLLNPPVSIDAPASPLLQRV